MFRTVIASLAGLGLTSAAFAADDAARGRGPYRVEMSAQPGLPHHTIYAPRDLAALGDMKLPVVVWGNGGCRDEGNRYQYFLSDIASRGYLVIALGDIEPGVASGWPAETSLPTDPPPLDAPAPTEPGELTEAIDWAIAQATDPASPLNGKIDAAKIAVAGHSCGGLQALTIASTDPRVVTTLLMNSGVWNVGPGGLPGAPAVTKRSLATIHGSIAYISGEHDPALANSRDDFSRLSGVPALLAYRLNVAHSGTYWLPNGGAYGTVAGEWLDWQLKGDLTAKNWFIGDKCRLCIHPKWRVETKDLH